MISIIIPTYNEEEIIAESISEIKKRDHENLISEIIISDGHSTDKTFAIALDAGATVHLSNKKGRAAQMNYGASKAKGEILYFLHADSIPPNGFTTTIADAVENNFVSGCFRLDFDYQHWFLKTNCWFTRFDVNALRFGDQSLVVVKNVFQKCGRFDESLLIMEDQEIIHRIKKHGKFKVMDDAVTTSARKYLDHGIYRTHGMFFKIWCLYYLGYSQDYLLKFHR